MKYLEENEVLRVPIVWDNLSGEPWLMSFDFIEQDERLQCVGMSMRSYIKHEERGNSSDRYHSYWRGGPVGQNPFAREWDRHLEDYLEEHPDLIGPHHPISEHDPHAYIAGAHENLEMLEPRVLDASTLRSLPFARVLSAAREYLAANTERWQLPRQRAYGEFRVLDDPEANAEMERRFWETFDSGGPFRRAEEDLWGELRAPEKRPPGRPMKYTYSQLVLVAEQYREACGGGLSYPTKYVAGRLNLNRNVAAKLVAKCRRLGLLGPTEKRKAGGVAPLKPSESDAD